jgi:hypothetical protein
MDRMEYAYREALVQCADRYIPMIEDNPCTLDEQHEPLLRFTHELRHRAKGDASLPFYPDRSEPYPLMKLNRWLGYIQGVLICHNVTTVEAERDWTRPLFRPYDFG